MVLCVALLRCTKFYKMDTDNSGVLRHAKVGMNLGKGGLRMGQHMVAQKIRAIDVKAARDDQ